MRVVITGGGTGGHVYPALALAERLRQDGWTPVMMGHPRGMEARLARQAGLAFYPVRAQGLLGKSLARRVVAAGAAAWGTLVAVRLMRALRPAVCVGTGGYVTGPVCLGAFVARVPVLILEENVWPGYTTRRLASLAQRIALGYEETLAHLPEKVRGRCTVTGNPVRPRVLAVSREEARAALGLASHRPVVLVVGGSLGATALNRAGKALVGRLTAAGVGLVWVTGQREYLRYAGYHRPEAGVLVYPYMEDMALALAAADVAVCRAGAMTLAELCARGLPAILVPSPHVSENHQERNAAALAERGAARVLREADLTPERVWAEVSRLLSDPGEREEMGRRARAVFRPDALERLVAEVRALAEAQGGGSS